jgi:hypothetical protein
VIVLATTTDGGLLIAQKAVRVTIGGYPKDGPATALRMSLLGSIDTAKMLVNATSSNASYIASLELRTGGELLVEADTTPWLSQNPYFSFKSAHDVGGKFEVEVTLNSGERVSGHVD